jgi:hypothetical protein
MESYDWLFGDSLQTQEESEVIDEPIWKTRDGTEIPISHMATRHVTCCLKYCIKWQNQKWKTIFENELKRRKSSPLEGNFSL